MVNFRFHLVSIIAVFLALGLGILMGSTVIDQAIVDRLDREIKEVRRESRDLRRQNSELRGELERADAYIEDAAPYSVEGRLTDTPVVLVAERGVDGGAVKAARDLLAVSGAAVPAVVWLEDKWLLDDAESIEQLRQAARTEPGSAVTTRAEALAKLARRLSTAPRAGTSGQVPAQPDLLTRLADAGFVEVDGDVDVAQFPEGVSRALLVTGTDSALAGSEVTEGVTSAFVDQNVPTTVAEVFAQHDGDDAPQRGDAVAFVRHDGDLARIVSTVDDLDLVEGRVASALALQYLVRGDVGHYGYGPDAQQALPPWPEP
jgi:hypothetical protein